MSTMTPRAFALMSWYFEEQLEAFTPYADTTPHKAFQIIGTSGTITTVAASYLRLKRYDRNKVDGLVMNSTQVDSVIREYLALGPIGRRQDPRIGRERHTQIMSGAAILTALMRVWPTERMSVADRGLREGLLYAQMSGDGALTWHRIESGTMTGKNTSGRGQRDLKVKVKTARGRKLSSTRWLERQLNDPYVAAARRDGYRGRAAYKLLELDDKYRFPGARARGWWTWDAPPAAGCRWPWRG